MNDDLISREAVGYYIQSYIHEIITESGTDKNEHTNSILRAILNGIKTMPSVTPKAERRWIPCAERLPEKDGYYLVTTKWKSRYLGNVYIDTTMARYREKSKEWTYNHVIAWMPLPEPYKAESEGEA